MDERTSAAFPEFDPEDVIANEVVEHPEATNERSISRRLALQVLYEVDSADHPVSEVMQTQVNYHMPSNKVSTYMHNLVMGVLEKYQSIDRVIRHFAPDFPLSQVALIDRNILRIAIYEMAMETRVPERVAIDEAVELAKLYGADGSTRFINGVLGAIASDRKTVALILEPDLEEKDT